MQERKRKKLKKEVKVFAAGLGAGFVVLLLALWLLGGKSEKTQATLNSTSQTSSQVSQSSQQIATSSTETIENSLEEATATSTSQETGSQASSSASSAGMNIEQIAKGDYSSILGTWVSSSGESYRFGPNGLEKEGFSIGSLAYTNNGTLQGNFFGTTGGAVIEFVPAGTTVSSITDEETGQVFSDMSDKGVDRIWMGQSFSDVATPANFYYKAD